MTASRSDLERQARFLNNILAHKVLSSDTPLGPPPAWVKPYGTAPGFTGNQTYDHMYQPPLSQQPYQTQVTTEVLDDPLVRSIVEEMAEYPGYEFVLLEHGLLVDYLPSDAEPIDKERMVVFSRSGVGHYEAPGQRVGFRFLATKEKLFEMEDVSKGLDDGNNDDE